MKRLLSAALAATIAVSASSVAFANGAGQVIAPPPVTEPAPPPPVAEPAPAPVVQKATQSQPWWLYALGAAVIVGIIIAVSDDDS